MSARPSEIRFASTLERSDGSRFMSCERKTRYNTLGEAIPVAHRLSPRKNPTFRIRVYPCQYCGGFHLTNREIGKAGKPKTTGITPIDVLRSAQDSQIKTIMQLRQKLAEVESKPCACWWCALVRIFSTEMWLGGE